MSYTREAWARALLAAIGNTNPAQTTVQWVVNWTCAETTHPPGASFNLLNTTEPNTPGVVSDFNSVGVKNYDSFEHGIRANAKVLHNGYYPAVLVFLQGTANPSFDELNRNLGIWGTGAVAQTLATMHGNGQELFGGSTTMGVPANWHDDGTTLTAPNGHRVVLGFRDWVLNHNWDPANIPLEEEYHADPVQFHGLNFGAGQRQCFLYNILWYTPGQGVVQEQELGAELQAAYAAISKTQTPPPTPINPDVFAQLQAASVAIQKAQSELAAPA